MLAGIGRRELVAHHFQLALALRRHDEGIGPLLQGTWGQSARIALTREPDGKRRRDQNKDK
jgi:hypothetical protein